MILFLEKSCIFALSNKKLMNYPLISEYVEAIMSAEDNFKELSYLRPVFGDDGLPVMTSGNFAVVFKMRDERDGKLYALKCFTKEQEGRTEAYREIAKELKDVSSPYLVAIQFLEKELFVDTDQTTETEFPVLLMDWVEGKTLDKYLRENLDDKYALEMLAYRFSLLAQWLIPQPLAHGDLKPDNILVREDGSLVLVDYDGMYVPAMKGQKARELGSPDFRHPQRTEEDFDEYIDDFPIATILFSLNHLKRRPFLLDKYGAKDRLLLSKIDYYDIDNSDIIEFLYPADDFFDLNLEILTMTLKDKYFKKVPLSWFPLLNEPIEIIPHTKKVIKVKYNGSTFNMIFVKGGSFLMGAQRNSERFPNYDYEAENDEGPVREVKVNDFWICESLISNEVWPKYEWDYFDGYVELSDIQKLSAINGVSFDECCDFINKLRKETNVLFDFPTEAEWEYAARGGLYSKGYKFSGSNNIEEVAVYGLNVDNYSIPPSKIKTKKPNELGIYDMSGALYEWCKDEYSATDFIDFDRRLIPDLLDNPIIHVKRGGCITSNAHECRITNRRRDNLFKIAADKERRTYYKDGDNYYPSVYWWQVGLRLVVRNIDFKAIVNDTILSYSDVVSEEDKNLAVIDEFGAVYTYDHEKLIGIPDDIIEYSVKDGTKIFARDFYYDSQEKRIQIMHLPMSLLVIGRNAFWNCKYLYDANIPDGVFKIGDVAFCLCESLTRLALPSTIKYIGTRAFSQCYSLREMKIPDGVEVLEDGLFSFCINLEKIELPTSIVALCDDVFWNCEKLKSITLPEKVKEIKTNPFRGSGIEEIVCKSPYFVFENGLLMTADRKELIACLTRKKYISIPSTIKVIKDYAFSGCKNTEQIFLPEGLTDIMGSAITGCSSLSELTIPSSVRAIHRSFLAECGNFKRLIIRSKDIWFEDRSTFYKVESLSKIIIPQEIKEEFSEHFSEYSEITEYY